MNERYKWVNLLTREEMLQELDEIYITIIDCFLEMFLREKQSYTITYKPDGNAILKYDP